MSVKAIAAALVALAACTGCATSHRAVVAQTPSDVVIVRDDTVGRTNLMTRPSSDPNLRDCGWYDGVAGVCDSLGD